MFFDKLCAFQGHLSTVRLLSGNSTALLHGRAIFSMCFQQRDKSILQSSLQQIYKLNATAAAARRGCPAAAARRGRPAAAATGAQQPPRARQNSSRHLGCPTVATAAAR